jgi:hypothetical protein
MSVKIDPLRNDDYKVIVENEKTRLTLHPNRGGLISSILLKEKNYEYLLKGSSVLNTPDINAFPSGDPMHTSFRGGYFEVIPNAGYSNRYSNVAWALHSETPYIPWELQFDEENNENSILCIARLRRYPLILYRRISLEGYNISIKEKVQNLSSLSLKFSWLHHPTFAGDLLDESTELVLPNGKIISDNYLGLEETETIPGSSGDWPFLNSKDGNNVDLSRYPAPGTTNTNDLIYFPDIPEPRFKLYNHKKKFGIACEWDRSIFRSLWIWRCMGGGSYDPWYGRQYATSVEITSSWPVTGISQQVENNTALTINGNQSLDTFLNYSLLFH